MSTGVVDFTTPPVPELTISVERGLPWVRVAFREVDGSPTAWSEPPHILWVTPTGPVTWAATITPGVPHRAEWAVTGAQVDALLAACPLRAELYLADVLLAASRRRDWLRVDG